MAEAGGTRVPEPGRRPRVPRTVTVGLAGQATVSGQQPEEGEAFGTGADTGAGPGWAWPRLSGRYGVNAMTVGPLSTVIGLPAVLVAVRSGITVPGKYPGSKISLRM